MYKKIIIPFFSFFICGLLFSGERTVPPLSYSNALIEYYSQYSNQITERQIEESYILLFPKEYVSNGKDEIKAALDRANVRQSIAKSMQEINKGNHEYTVMLRGQLGDYDKAFKGFNCVFLSSWSCVDIGPLNKIANPAPEESEAQSIIARGVLFNKVNKIKLFFSNPENFNFLRYPEKKAKILIKNGPNPSGPYEVVLIVDVQILKGTDKTVARKLRDVTISMRTEESNYFMAARINSIDVFGDFALVNKLGRLSFRGKKVDS